MKPWVETGYRDVPERGVPGLPGGDGADPEGGALHHVRLLRLGVQLDGVRPRVLRPAASPRASLRRRPARPGPRRAARALQRRARHLGLHPVLLLQRALPEGRRPRDAIAKLGAESIRLGIDGDMGAKHAQWFVHSAKTTGWLRETELVPKTQGILGALKETKFALSLFKHGKVPLIPHVAENVQEARALRGREGAGPRRRGGHRPGRARARPPRTRRRDLARGGGMKVAYYKGCLASLSAKELDTSTQALAPMLGIELEELKAVTCCGAGDIHEAEPDYYLHLNARIRRLRRGDRLRHADDDLQRLHAQPAAGEPLAPERRRAAGAREREPGEGRRASIPAASRSSTSSG